MLKDLKKNEFTSIIFLILRLSPSSDAQMIVLIEFYEFRSIRSEQVTVLNNVNPVAVFGCSLRLGKKKSSTIKIFLPY